MSVSQHISRLLLVGLILVQTCSVINADDDESNNNSIDYNNQIRPILEERCFACHGALKQEASLRLDSVANIKKGGDSGEVISINQPSESELIRRLVDDDESFRMPPEGKPLSQEEVEHIRKWIKQGAKAPANDQAEIAPDDHWAFKVPQQANVGEGNPIDQLIERARKRAGLKATNETVSKSLLLRRVYLDLIGVPPTLAEIKEFENDSSANAFEKVVDRLLQSPQYGERWGRHWMDVWRYTDWYGLGAQLRNSQKHIWHWRDWIVESLNEDKGYDQMIREMLAADELYPTDRSRLRATGFLARNYYLFNRTTWLDSTIEHTGKAFLGLTFNCAKCHDHKYDPISQKDYYQLRAIFEPHQVRLDPQPGTINLESDGLPRVFDAHPDAKTYIHLRGNEKAPDKSQIIKPNVPNFFGYTDFASQEIHLPPKAFNPALQSFVLADQLASLDAEIKKAEKNRDASEQKLNAIRSEPKPKKSSERIRYDEFKLGSIKSVAALVDNFDRFDDQVWKIKNGKWKVEKGKLVQSETGSISRIVESLVDHPSDFLLEVRLSVSAGQLWKSFGIRFDANANHDKTVYLSGHTDSKIQVSFANNGQSTYPTNGLARIPVELNKKYTVRVAVRERSINVSVDGKHLVSYAFPVSRQAGKLQLMSFDSVASFDSIAIYALPSNVGLVDSPAANVMTLEQAELSHQLNVEKLNELKCKRIQLAASHAADLAKSKKGADTDKAIRLAAKEQINYEIAVQKRTFLENKLALNKATAKDKAKFEKAINSSQNKLDELKSKKPGTRYESIRASLKALEGPDEKADSRNKPYPQISTGRRTAFAKWIVDRSNPLTARVAINQIWMRHFGQPLVDPVTDFGRRAKPPVQQELLDWLAFELAKNQWTMKRVHRLIVTSKTYRLAGYGLRDAKNSDPENHYYLIRKPFRMESQAIRDSLLKLSGQLEEKLGGPPIDPKAQANTTRRSLYFRQSRDHQHKFVGMFDDADILRCYRRQESIIPQQALTMANSQVAYRSANQIAKRLTSSFDKDDQFIQQSFLLILCRKPTSEELGVCLDTLGQLTKLATGKKESVIRARTNLVLGILNSNDFVTIR